MSFEALRREILESAEKEANRILEEARSKAEKILKEAEDKAEAIKRRKRSDVEARLRNNMEVALAVKRLEGKRLVYMKIMELLRMVEEASVERLDDIRRDRSRYLPVIKNFIEKGFSELGVERAKMFYSIEDEDLIKSVDFKEAVKGFDLTLVNSGERFFGGIIMSDVDEKVFYIATFEGRLREVMDRDLHIILDILRGDDGK